MPRPLIRRAIVISSLALTSMIGSVVASVVAGCASTGQPRRNGMEAPPPFPVAPDFNLPSGDGEPRSLGSLMGPKGLVLVLYRGHW